MSQEKPKKAVVATISYAGFEFPGLQMPDGSYGITASQAWKMLKFSEHPNYASRTVKRLLGKDHQTIRIASELNPKKVNVILLKDFGLLVMKLAFKGNEVAQAIAEASVTTTIEQAFDIAFDNKQKLEEYQERLKIRVQGKIVRRTLTNAIDNYIKENSDELSDNYKKWIYNNCTEAINRAFFGRSAKQLKENWGCKEVREAMTLDELADVRFVEKQIVKAIEKGGEPLSATKEVLTKIEIEKVER